MEKMAYRVDADFVAVLENVQTRAGETGDRSISWRNGLPTLVGTVVTLRELRPSDAPSLFALLANEQVTRFISPPPTTIDGFERFIAWTHRQREAGQYVCFAIVPNGADRAIGVIQIRALDPAFDTAEWGFAMASEFWGTGVFMDAAERVLGFAFDTLGVHRLEARAAIRNGRGNGALRKLGAVQESVLRRSLLKNGEYVDQTLWSILAEDWREAAAAWDQPALVH
jgi:RimJ/RimL family protein N-acetyltransferase